MDWIKEANAKRLAEEISQQPTAAAAAAPEQEGTEGTSGTKEGCDIDAREDLTEMQNEWLNLGELMAHGMDLQAVGEFRIHSFLEGKKREGGF